MIEKMNVVHVVTVASQKKALLDGLRSLGIVHLAEKESADPALTERFAALSKLSMLLGDYAGEEQEKAPLSDGDFDKLFSQLNACLDKKQQLEQARAAAAAEAERLREWGDFSPEAVAQLKQEGIELHFYRMDKKLLAALSADKEVRYIRLRPVSKMETVAVVGALPSTYGASEFPLPEKGLSQLEGEIAQCDQGLAECTAFLKKAAHHLPSFQDQMLKSQNAAEYSSVSNTVGASDGLIWLSGYLPVADADKFRAAAKEHNWAFALEDPDDDDEKVPTKVKYNKITRLMIPIFDILGTVPGYREYDISFWFLAFFTLFFAMIIGDAGYGFLFLLAAAGLTIKTKKTTNTSLLLWVLAGGTMIWGAVTGTGFGLEGAMKIPFLKALVIPSFANYPEYFGVTAGDQQNAIMKFCFTIGAVQLALACVMNIKRKLGEKNLSWVADLGWLCSICAMYFVVLFLVIGQNVALGPVAGVIGCGFLLVVLFGGMSPDKSFSQGLKAGLADAFTVFLNTISAFGNIMSYIRLFAVGLASLAIAQSFNNMAAGFQGPLIVVGALIMIVGHALNVVMGLLSVVVHGARLNLLEFSGQLGMEWAGIAYHPFKKFDKINK